MAAGFVLTGCTAPPVTDASAHFGLAQVEARARALADKPYRPPAKIPEPARSIDRKTWSQIDFRNDAALWHDSDSPFEVQFFHPGSFYDTTVTLHQVTADGVKPVDFSKRGFVYPDKSLPAQLPDDLGYAGFRLHYPLQGPGKPEVVTFLGASYFRALGKDQVYGLSARGLAIDTALDSGEEFPRFREFWLCKPAPGADRMTIYALLNGPSITGAYRFVIRPGTATVMDIKARLYPRKPIKKLGLAALTSMFMHGESSLTASRDWRPEVHDSDGLLLVDGKGEWLWRPLVNPRHVSVNSLQADDPRGFGLIQSDRDFDHYQDLRDHYERRPSAWVTPKGDWGRGHVELVEIPSDTMQTDNMVAFWVPDAAAKPGHELAYDYRLTWELQRPSPPATGEVSNTLVGEVPVHENAPDAARRLVVDFSGGPLRNLSADAEVVPKITVADGGKLLAADVRPNPHIHGWRLQFDVLPADADQVLELRAFLADAQGTPLTETWSYALNQ